MLHQVWGSYNMMIGTHVHVGMNLHIPKQVVWLKLDVGEVRLNIDGSVVGGHREQVLVGS